MITGSQINQTESFLGLDLRRSEFLQEEPGNPRRRKAMSASLWWPGATLTRWRLDEQTRQAIGLLIDLLTHWCFHEGTSVRSGCTGNRPSVHWKSRRQPAKPCLQLLRRTSKPSCCRSVDDRCSQSRRLIGRSPTQMKSPPGLIPTDGESVIGESSR